MAAHSIPAPTFAPNWGTFSLGRLWAAASTMLRARRTRRLLAEMDGRLMADIGVSRSDAIMEANRPFWDVR